MFFNPTKVTVLKMYGTEPRYNESRYNKIHVITNTIQRLKRMIYPDVTKNCHHVRSKNTETPKKKNKYLLYLNITNILVVFMQNRYIEGFDLTNP